MLLRAKLRDRDVIRPSRLTLDRWLDEWLAQVALARPRTLSSYRQKTDHIRPILGARPLASITPRDIRLALGTLADRGMSATMLQHVYRTLSTALNVALREHHIADNPCRDVATPRRREFEAQTLTVGQSQRLIYTAWDTRLGPLITVALSTGMRAGELLALTWDDVDMEHGLITVNKSVQWKPKGKHQAGPTKTRSARRTIRVDTLAVEALLSQRQRCARMRLQAKVWEDRNLIFPAQRGGYWIPSGAFVREFRRLLTQADCPQIRWHDLRHTAGLYLTRSVGVVVASRILGHADPGITSRYYGHSQVEDFTAAARAMAALLQPKTVESEVQ